MLELFSYSLSFTDILVLCAAAIMLGMAKVGIAGIGMIAVPLMAIAFGGKESTGILLTILIFADLFGVWYFHQHASWHHLRRLLPFALLGVVIGTIAGNKISDEVFKVVMAMIIFASLPLMIWQQRSNKITVPSSLWFTVGMGVLGGITTMVGTLAGPVMALYLLSMRFPKNEFIGTAAWFFLVINVVKVPFHVVVWKTITWESFLLTTVLIPAVAFGAFVGLQLVKRIPENPYRWFVIAMTALAALTMLVSS
jgi:uncharacterized membrane protein YfcA